MTNQKAIEAAKRIRQAYADNTDAWDAEIVATSFLAAQAEAMQALAKSVNERGQALALAGEALVDAGKSKAELQALRQAIREAIAECEEHDPNAGGLNLWVFKQKTSPYMET